MVNKELNFLAPKALIIDLVIFAATLPLYGLGISIPLGLLTGTAAMLINITLLGYASERAVERPLKSAKRYMFSFYLIRMCIMGAAIVAGYRLPFINGVCVCLPLFFPKVIYTVNAVITEKKGG